MARLEAAFVRRDPLGLELVRLVDGEGDALGGLIVDRYGEVARVEMLGPAWQPRAHDVAAQIASRFSDVTSVVGVSRERDGRHARLYELIGTCPRAHVVHEAGLRFLVRALEPDAVGAGVFMDQRHGRAFVRAHAAGGPALNLFAHAGAFGVAAAAGGASQVDHVDAARKCASWAALNLALNGHDPKHHRFLVDDVFKVMQRAASRGPHYQVIVCDPPTTAIRPGGKRFRARDELPLLAEQCCAALMDGGALLLACNDRSLVDADIEAAARTGARAAGRTIKSLDALELGADFTARGDPRLASTKGVLVVLGG